MQKKKKKCHVDDSLLAELQQELPSFGEPLKLVPTPLAVGAQAEEKRKFPLVGLYLYVLFNMSIYPI
jgi:hypothetical protein